MQRSSVNPRSFISCNERENNMRLTIAFLQLLPTGSLMGNLEKGIEACRQAKEKGADIAIFPEMWRNTPSPVTTFL